MSMRNVLGSERATRNAPPFGPSTWVLAGRPATCVTAAASDSVARIETVDSSAAESAPHLKSLSKLAFQVVLGAFGRGQDLADLEEIEGAVGADLGSNQDVGRQRLELLARHRMEQELRRPGHRLQRIGH